MGQGVLLQHLERDNVIFCYIIISTQ